MQGIVRYFREWRRRFACLAIMACVGCSAAAAYAPGDVDPEQVLKEAETAILAGKGFRGWAIPGSAAQIVETFLVVQAAAGIEPSKGFVFSRAMVRGQVRTRVDIERRLRDWRVEGFRPDVDQTMSVVDYVNDDNIRCNLVHRLLNESVRQRDAWMAAKWFDVALRDAVKDEGSADSIRSALSLYAPMLNRQQLRELKPQLARLDPFDDILNATGLELLRKGELWDALRLIGMIGDSELRYELVLEDAAVYGIGATESVDALLHVFAAVVREDESRGAEKLRTIRNALVGKKRSSLAQEFLRAAGGRHPQYAILSTKLADEIDYLSSDIAECRRRLETGKMTARVRTHLHLLLAEQEMRAGRMANAEPALDRAWELIPTLPDADAKGDLEAFAHKLDAARNRLDGVKERLKRADFDPVAAAIQFCRECNCHEAADSLVQAVIKVDTYEERLVTACMLNIIAENGDIASMAALQASLPADVRQPIADEKSAEWGYNLARSAGAAPAFAWANAIPDPVERSRALIAIAETLILAREPSYIPQ